MLAVMVTLAGLGLRGVWLELDPEHAAHVSYRSTSMLDRVPPSDHWGSDWVAREDGDLIYSPGSNRVDEFGRSGDDVIVVRNGMLVADYYGLRFVLFDWGPWYMAAGGVCIALLHGLRQAGKSLGARSAVALAVASSAPMTVAVVLSLVASGTRLSVIPARFPLLVVSLGMTLIALGVASLVFLKPMR